MKAYSSIAEVEIEVIATLADFADEYDTEGIAREISDFDESGRLVADLEREDYWHIVAQYAA